MNHIQGFLVSLEQSGTPYEETYVPEDRTLWLTYYDENTILQGRCNTSISQVAIHKTHTDPKVPELFDLNVRFYSDFNFYSANAVQISVCIKGGQVLKQWSAVLWKVDFAEDHVSYGLTRR